MSDNIQNPHHLPLQVDVWRCRRPSLLPDDQRQLLAVLALLPLQGLPGGRQEEVHTHLPRPAKVDQVSISPNFFNRDWIPNKLDRFQKKIFFFKRASFFEQSWLRSFYNVYFSSKLNNIVSTSSAANGWKTFCRQKFWSKNYFVDKILGQKYLWSKKLFVDKKKSDFKKIERIGQKVHSLWLGAALLLSKLKTKNLESIFHLQMLSSTKLSTVTTN